MFPQKTQKYKTPESFLILQSLDYKKNVTKRRTKKSNYTENIAQSNSCEESDRFESFLHLCDHQDNYKKVLPKVQN